VRADLATARALALEAVAEPLTAARPVSFGADGTLAMTYAYEGDIETTRTVLARASEQLDALGEFPFEQAVVHSTAANLLLMLGDLDDARREAEASLRIARPLQNPTALALALFAVGWSFAVDEPDAALAALDESIALTRAGGVDSAFGSTLSIAALIRARQGDARGALEGAREAVAYSHDVGDRSNLATAIVRGAAITAILGHGDLGAVLSGIVDGPALAIHLSEHFSASEIVDYRSVQERTRTAIGDAAYDAATARGAAMGADEVVPYVLSELDRLLDDLDDT
jgi:tetratricopeptide (TPR) repeat protein